MPDFGLYGGVTGAALAKLKANTPGFMAENELRMEMLKRQMICHTQVRTTKKG